MLEQVLPPVDSVDPLPGGDDDEVAVAGRRRHLVKFLTCINNKLKTQGSIVQANIDLKVYSIATREDKNQLKKEHYCLLFFLDFCSARKKKSDIDVIILGGWRA